MYFSAALLLQCYKFLTCIKDSLSFKTTYHSKLHVYLLFFTSTVDTQALFLPRILLYLKKPWQVDD